MIDTNLFMQVDFIFQNAIWDLKKFGIWRPQAQLLHSLFAYEPLPIGLSKNWPKLMQKVGLFPEGSGAKGKMYNFTWIQYSNSTPIQILKFHSHKP